MSKNKPISRILIFLLFLTVNSSLAQNNNPTSSCPSSSCGNIPEIRFPFRLNGNPRSCGYNNHIFELQCQNNQTFMIARSRRYLVQEINYADYSIRLVDPGIHRSNLSSCPIYSNGYGDWPDILTNFFDWNVPVVFINCLVPVINNPDYIQAPFCSNRSSIFANSSDVYSYVMFGERVQVSDLEDFCSVGSVVGTSALRPARGNGSSLAGVYDDMAYGFELSWFRVLCGECERTLGFCSLDGNRISCIHYCREDTPVSQLRFGCQVQYWGIIIGAYGMIAVGKIQKLHLLSDNCDCEFKKGGQIFFQEWWLKAFNNCGFKNGGFNKGG